MDRDAAQQRLNRIRAFQAELAALEEQGILTLDAGERSVVAEYHHATIDDLARHFDVDRDDRQRRMSLGMRIASVLGAVGLPGYAVYGATKGGVIAFTRTLAVEWARHNVQVNCVCPGPTDTPLFAAQPERMREALTRAIPFRRIAQPEEIAEAVMFFLGRRSDYITGQVLSVSGGLTMVD